MKKLGIEIDELSEEEKKIVIEKANINSKALRKLYNFLNDYMGK